MNRILTAVIVTFCLTMSASAHDWQACLEYLHPKADPRSSWELTDDGEGVFISKWNLPDPKPTEEQLAAVEKDALAWKAEQKKLAVADYDAWDVAELRVLVKALLAEVNELRVKAGLTALTSDDLKEKLCNQADAEEAK